MLFLFLINTTVRNVNILTGIDRPQKAWRGDNKTPTKPLQYLSNLNLVLDKKWVLATSASTYSNQVEAQVIIHANFHFPTLYYPCVLSRKQSDEAALIMPANNIANKTGKRQAKANSGQAILPKTNQLDEPAKNMIKLQGPHTSAAAANQRRAAPQGSGKT